ncbi:RepB family plasmid replication initiator protein [Enterobacter hormaechei]|uniref:RepB family plasmid replication initiator protein n=1 Tax=Enterobacter hormaechei TaxID=158836 RepID=UPI001981D251|nr:RepB family plasmid replication initiator protein [Enterobacter hormaechei]MBN6402110.1 RepB family plasmid replication initiator protein [Enterobacter hormaechei]
MTVRQGKLVLKKRPLYQANVLTQARDGLSRDQRRLFYLMLDSISTQGWPENGVFKIDHLFYSQVFKLSEKEAREDIRRAMADFKGKEVTLYESWEGGVSVMREMSWTTSRWTSEERGIYQIKINPDLREFMEPFAHDLPFTMYRLEQVSRVPSKYSMKLLEALSQFKTTGFFAIRLEDLRVRWELPASYEKWSLLKARVLDPALADVRKIEEFRSVTMMEKREGTGKNGKVTGVSFAFTIDK